MSHSNRNNLPKQFLLIKHCKLYLFKLDEIIFLNNSDLGMVNFFVAGTNFDYEATSKT